MRTLRFLVFVVVATTLISNVAKAQVDDSKNEKKPAKSTQTYTPGTYVDNNNNGICDNSENRTVKNRGNNYVDADNDGVCDNYSANTGRGNGYGKAYRHRYGNGCCNRYGRRFAR